MLGVIEESKDKVVFFKEELDDLINRVADEAAEHFSQKFMDVIEQRDRKLMHDLTQTMEQKRLEVAATTEEERPGFFSRFFKK